MTIHRDAGAVLPCAGSGTRVGADRPKQFLDLDGRPVFHRPLAAFLAHPRIAAVVLVVAPSERAAMTAALGAPFAADLAAGRLLLASGGAERWQSVQNGIAALPPECLLAAIHDVARPFVAPSDIDAALEAAVADGACTLAIPCPDTVKLAVLPAAPEAGPQSATLPLPGQPAAGTGNGRAPLVETTIDRRRIWLTQTPQAFRRDVLEDCYARLPGRTDLAPTDEAGLAEAFGHAVRLVPGADRLRKITTSDDLDWARWMAARV